MIVDAFDPLNDVEYWTLLIKHWTIFRCIQCDQIGQFLILICNKFSHKSSQNWWLMGYFEKHYLFKQKLLWLLYGERLENLGNFLFQHLVTLGTHIENLSSASKKSLMTKWCLNVVVGIEIFPQQLIPSMSSVLLTLHFRETIINIFCEDWLAQVIDNFWEGKVRRKASTHSEYHLHSVDQHRSIAKMQWTSV